MSTGGELGREPLATKVLALHGGIGWPGALVLLLWCGIVIAFSGSAFRIDEPNMLAVARQIAAEPLDPYGFEINWLGRSEPAFNVLSNPPLLPYWLAAWASIFGWTESAIRMAMLPFGILLLFAGMRLGVLFEFLTLDRRRFDRRSRARPFGGDGCSAIRCLPSCWSDSGPVWVCWPS
jgi:hypothetical protein